MPSLNEMLEERQRKEAQLLEERKHEEGRLLEAKRLEARPLEEKEAKLADPAKGQAKLKKNPPRAAPIDKETWESLLNCVYVTKHKSNRYFLEYSKKVATAKSKCKKEGIPFDQVMIPTTPVIRDIRRALLFLAKHRPKDAEGTIELPAEEGDVP